MIAALLLAAIACAQTDEYVERAKALMRQYPTIDGHNDLPYQYKVQVNNQIGNLDINFTQPSLHTDIPRLREGLLGGQYWSVYVPCNAMDKDAVRATMDQIDVTKRMIAKYPDVFEQAYTADDIERIHSSGKIACMFGIEGGHSIDNSLGALRMFQDMVKSSQAAPSNLYMTLTHNCDLAWADAHNGQGPNGGLSLFGQEVLFEMNRQGTIIDLSHVTSAVMRQALVYSVAPVMFSHSSVYSLCPVSRNVPDDVLFLVRDTRSVVMVTFVCEFISPDYDSGTGNNRPDVVDVADHIDYITNLIGWEYVGVGGDYDGVDCLPTGLEDVSTYPNLFAELLRRGYTDEQVRAVMGGNILRVMREVEEVARTLQEQTEADDNFIVVEHPCSSGFTANELVGDYKESDDV